MFIMQSEHVSPSIALAAGISSEFLRYHRLCPIGDSPDGTLLVATCDRTVAGGLDDLAIAYGRIVTSRQVGSDDLEQLIERIAPSADRAIELSLASVTADVDEVTTDVRDLAEQPPVV